MADCGATGSALDRAAQWIGTTAASSSAGQRDGAKALSSFMGHAAVSVQQQQPMPMAPPEHLVLRPSPDPYYQLSSIRSPPAIASTAAALQNHHHNHSSPYNEGLLPLVGINPFQQQRQQQQRLQTLHVPPPPTHLLLQPHSFSMQQQGMHHHHNLPLLHNDATRIMALQQEQQHQQQFYTMQIQQQQHLILMQQQQQQMQAVALQQQQQQQQQQNQEETATTNAAAVEGHEGLVKPVTVAELQSAWAEAAVQDNNFATADHHYHHEGWVQPAGMDELAAAWDEAQAEYETELLSNNSNGDDDDDENLSNLWRGGDNDKPRSYEFIHREEILSSEQLDTDWMEEGHREFRAGNMARAIRAFELELLHVDPDNATALRMLGHCHAENDMDAAAIQCLEQAVDRDPYSAQALLALGVSYVNELNHVAALQNLKAWITHNPKFAGLEVGDDVYGTPSPAAATATTTAAEAAFEEVQRLLLRALDFQTAEVLSSETSSTTTADVLEALGVVYNVSRDYEAAADAFRRACEIRPSDYQLWNKLGATLANGNRSSEALPAYHKALQLKPRYARAWLNMAISHSNLHQYNEASRCYLQTLSLNPAAVHCWSYLRIALSCSERWDLIPVAAAQDLNAFVEHFDFVVYETGGSVTVADPAAGPSMKASTLRSTTTIPKSPAMTAEE